MKTKESPSPWLILVNKTGYVWQLNRNGHAYISDRDLEGLDFCYRIPVKEAKKKFPELTRNEFASAILSGEELVTENWS